MQLKTVIARAFGERWTRILAGVVAATVLLPVRALAFSWIGPTGTTLDWSTNATYTLTGGAPPPTIVLTGTSDTAMGGSLEIDMHAYDAAPGVNAKEGITTFRDFSIPAGGETFSVSQGFSTILQNANLHVAVSVIRLSNNQRAFRIPRVNDSAGFNQQTFTEFMTNSGFLKQDFYRVIVDIQYTQAAQNPSSWDNVAHHKFDFSAVTPLGLLYQRHPHHPAPAQERSPGPLRLPDRDLTGRDKFSKELNFFLTCLAPAWILPIG